MCADQGIPCVEKDLYEADVRSADGIFLTSTLRNIGAVTELDGQPTVQSPLIEKLQRDFAALCEKKVIEVDKPRIEALMVTAS